MAGPVPESSDLSRDKSRLPGVDLERQEKARPDKTLISKTKVLALEVLLSIITFVGEIAWRKNSGKHIPWINKL